MRQTKVHDLHHRGIGLPLCEQTVNVIAVPSGGQLLVAGDDIGIGDGKSVHRLLQPHFSQNGHFQRQGATKSAHLHDREMQRIVALMQGDQMLAIGIAAGETRLYLHLLKMADSLIEQRRQNVLNRVVAQEKQIAAGLVSKMPVKALQLSFVLILLPIVNQVALIFQIDNMKLCPRRQHGDDLFGKVLPGLSIQLYFVGIG